MAVAARHCVAWCFGDGKRGHENQTRGLLRALAARLNLDADWLRPLSPGRALVGLVTGRYPGNLPDRRPDLLIGAGHATHLSLLTARRCCGGRVVVLMRPSLPLGCFDLCVVPEHDAAPPRGNVIVTRGVLNAMEPGGRHDPHKGLLLIGGPSVHHGWDESELLRQIETICHAGAQVDWVLSSSRRTPDGFLQHLRDRRLLNLRVVDCRDTGPEWLPAQLAETGSVWVSEDSVSMVFEAASSGAAVGLLALPRRRTGRVARGVDALLADGLATHFTDWRPGTPLPKPARPLDEAGRTAGMIVQRWFSD